MKKRLTLNPFLLAAAALMTGAGTSTQATTTYGPNPYLSFADSPFNGGSFSYFHLEDFDDGALNTPGLSVNAGLILNHIFPFVDSVGGNGSTGGTWWNGFGSGIYTLRFSFDGGTLGGLPTHAGLVLTDVFPPASVPFTFEAFDAGNNSIGVIGPTNVGDGLNTGETAEDRFFGIQYAGGISAIEIRSQSSDMEIDHVQYGLAKSTGVPDATSSLGLMTLGLATLGFVRRASRSA